MSFSYIISPGVLGKRVTEQLTNGIRVTGDNINTRRGEGVIHPLLYQQQQDNGRYLYDTLAVDFVALAYEIKQVYSITYKGLGQTYKYVIRHYCADDVSKENVDTALRTLKDTYASNNGQIKPFVEELVTEKGIWLPHVILTLAGLSVEFCTANGLQPPPTLPTENDDDDNPPVSS